MVNWSAIDTVLLDMDGTLLDLHFDSHFWLEHVPLRYAERRGVPLAEAKASLYARYQAMLGTIDWYSVDYWTVELDLDIALLKEEISHLIAVHPHVIPFLQALRSAGKTVALVTNAHFKSLSMKMERTALAGYFDRIICAHEFGVPKEQPRFWTQLQTHFPFVRERALFVDDSLPVLRAARAHGVAELLAVRQPDSRLPPREIEEFAAIASFADLLPIA